MAEWGTVDWTERDADIARKLNVSRERVRQVRQRKGIPKVTAPTAEQQLEAIESRVGLHNYTQAELSELTGYSVGHISTVLNRRGWVAKPAVRENLGVPKYNWEGVDWNDSNHDIAEQRGIPLDAVVARRSYLKVKGEIDG